MTLEYGVIYSTPGSEKKIAYRVLGEFFAAHPGFPTTRALRTQTVKGMSVGEARNITKTLDDGSKHNFRFIARESTYVIPDTRFRLTAISTSINHRARWKRLMPTWTRSAPRL